MTQNIVIMKKNSDSEKMNYNALISLFVMTYISKNVLIVGKFVAFYKKSCLLGNEYLPIF